MKESRILKINLSDYDLYFLNLKTHYFIFCWFQYNVSNKTFNKNVFFEKN